MSREGKINKLAELGTLALSVSTQLLCLWSWSGLGLFSLSPFDGVSCCSQLLSKGANTLWRQRARVGGSKLQIRRSAFGSEFGIPAQWRWGAGGKTEVMSASGSMPVQCHSYRLPTTSLLLSGLGVDISNSRGKCLTLSFSQWHRTEATFPWAMSFHHCFCCT